MELQWKQFQSFQPPILRGTETADDCENWIDDIEILFDSLDYPDERRIKLVPNQLQEIARSWWITTKRVLEQRGTVITWKVFKTEFYRRFFPGSYGEDKRVEFENLKQGQLNMEEYVAKFSTLLRFAPLIAGNDEAVADQFINGLNPEIISLMKVERPHNFADVLTKAKRAEASLIRQLRRLDVSRSQIQQSPLGFDSGSTSRKHELLNTRKKQFKKYERQIYCLGDITFEDDIAVDFNNVENVIDMVSDMSTVTFELIVWDFESLRDTCLVN
ncbi:uncharacterized protein [Primulina huaijiensis]|uniref:uncharacterized protein n=1 Tax=Primulina huaijiensis TaxID=1492673 RepID=UPI003CC71B77